MNRLGSQGSFQAEKLRSHCFGLLTSSVWVGVGSLVCFTVLCVLSSFFLTILLRMRQVVALLLMFSEYNVVIVLLQFPGL